MDIGLCIMFSGEIIGKYRGGNKVLFKKAFLRKCRIKILGSNNRILFEEAVRLDHVSIHIYGNNNFIYVKEGVSIKEGEIYIEDNGNSILIGEKTAFCGKVQLSCIEGTKINIGKECLLSSDIVCRTGDSHSLLDMDGKRINSSKDIEIKDRVWIGQRVMILKGVKICKNSMIAAGSIVTKKFEEENVVVGGNPARIVKRNIQWMYERISTKEQKNMHL